MTMRRLCALPIALTLCLTTAWADRDVEFVQELRPSQSEVPLGFGWSSAIQGDTAIVGAAGTAHVFVLRDGAWIDQQTLSVDQGQSLLFGFRVALDGDVAVVAAPGTLSSPHSPKGVYVFRRDGDVWDLEASFRGTTADIDDGRLVVGDMCASGDPLGNPGCWSGSATVYAYREGQWIAEQYLPNSYSGGYRNFYGVAVGIDGDTCVVGELSDCCLSAFGRVDEEWVEDTVDNRHHPSSLIALSGDTLAAGDWGGGFVPDIRVYTREGVAWSTQSIIRSEGWIPTSIALDDHTLLIGDLSTPAVYVYERHGERWLPSGTIETGEPWFGASVDLHDDMIIVGTSPDGETPGTASLFRLRCLMELALDIKPDSLDNPINPNSRGVTPVAILGSADHDVTTIDPSTLRFGPGGAELVHRNGHQQDINMDGYMDLMMHFRTQDIGLECGDTSATLTGEDYEGCEIEGTDKVTTVGRCSHDKSADEKPVVPVLERHARTKRRSAK